VALVGSLICLLTAIDAAGSGTINWSSSIAISLLVVGGVLLVLFIIIEAKFAKIPMIPLTLFKNRTAATVLISELFFGITFYPTYVYAPLYLQVIFRFTGLQSGFHFLPFLLSLVVTAVIAGLLMSFTGRTREVSWFATSILIAGAGAMSTLDERSSDGQRIGCMLLIGAACGLYLLPSSQCSKLCQRRKVISRYQWSICAYRC
jgi:MFS family permease